MPYRRRMDSRRPINSNKNIVQTVNLLATGSTTDFAIADTVDAPVLANQSEVVTGATINQIYLEIWIYGNTSAGTNSPIEWYVAKNPGNNLTIGSAAVLGTNDNKKWTYAVGKGLVGSSANGQPGYVIRGWFSVPKKMRRMGHDDRMQFTLTNSTGANINVCFLSIYKWYF